MYLVGGCILECVGVFMCDTNFSLFYICIYVCVGVYVLVRVYVCLLVCI